MVLRALRSGRGRSIVVMGVREDLIAASIPAKENAMRRSSQRHIVLGPQTWCLTALAERPCSTTCALFRERHVRTPFRIATRNV